MASQCPCARGSGRCVGQEPGSPGHGRRDYADPETEEVVHDLSEDERACPVCDAAYEPFGEGTSPQIDWQVRIVRVVHRCPRYRRGCRCARNGLVYAPARERRPLHHPVPRPAPPREVRARPSHGAQLRHACGRGARHVQGHLGRGAAGGLGVARPIGRSDPGPQCQGRPLHIGEHIRRVHRTLTPERPSRGLRERRHLGSSRRRGRRLS